MANPPYGRLTTTANPTAISPRGWSVNKPRTGEPFTITSVSGAANTCTVETSASHNYIDGDPVTVQGTGTNCDTHDSAVSTVNRTSGNATVTVVTADVHSLVAGARFFFEGAACKTVAGSYTVDAVNSTTEFTFTSYDTTTLSLTPASCVVAYSLPVTVTGATTFTFAKTGASGSASTGTVVSSRVIPPLAQASPFTENSDFDAPIHVLTWSPMAQTTGTWSGCDGNLLRQFHSTDPVWDASHQYMKLQCNTSGPLIFEVTWSGGDPTLTLIRNLNLGASATCKWDRVVGDRMWCVKDSGGRNKLHRYDNVSGGGASTLAFDFSTLTPACTTATFAGPTGGQDEGPGTTVGGHGAIRCQESASKYGVIVMDLALDGTATLVSRYTSPASSNSDVDYIHVNDKTDGTLLGVTVRWQSSATNSDNFNGSLTVSSGVGTLTKTSATFGYLVDGYMVRLIGCSTAAYNKLWTATSGSGTTATLDMTGAGDGSATGCQMAVQDRGMNYFKDNAGTLEINNAFRWVGSHGIGTVDVAGHAIWFGSAQLSGNICPVGDNGHATWHTDAALWTEQDTWVNQVADVAVCHNILPAGGGGTDNNVSASSAIGWLSGSPQATGASGSVGSLDPVTNANWFSTPTPWNSAEHLFYVSEAVEPGDPLNRWDLAHMYHATQTVGGFTSTPYPNLSTNGRYLVYNCTWRFNVADAPGVCLIDLTDWFSTTAPTLTSVTPDNGTQGTSPAVVLAGTNFDGGNASVSVSGTGVTPTSCVVDSAIQISCASFAVDLAATPIGPRNVTVTTDLGTSGPQLFTVNAAASAPTLSSISPSNGWRGSQLFVTFTGTDLDGANPVLNSSCPDVTFPVTTPVNATTITAQVLIGPGLGGAACNFSVSTDDGTSENRTFTVNAPQRPVHSLFSTF